MANADKMTQEIERIKAEYLKGDVCMAELLADISPSKTDLTFEDCFYIYCKLMNMAEKDIFLRGNEDEGWVEDIINDTRYDYDKVIKEME